MHNITDKAKQKIDKRHIAATVLFAIDHIPHIDEATLTKFVDLINITGNFNSISHGRLIKKMNLLIHLVPGTCKYSLLMLVELLDICLPANSDNGVNTLRREFNEATTSIPYRIG